MTGLLLHAINDPLKLTADSLSVMYNRIFYSFKYIQIGGQKSKLNTGGAGEEDYEPEVILGYDTQSCLKQTKQRKRVCVFVCTYTIDVSSTISTLKKFVS